jgi:hypothetical protein
MAATVGDGSVALSWSAPSSNGDSAITDYIIEYKLTSGGVWSPFADGASTATTATVTSLSNNNSYDFRAAAVNAVGQGATSASVTATPGSPAQVIVQSMIDVTVPSIAADVRITNEGLAAYEYQYTWCITDSDINQCGGGDDVFTSMAARLIQPSMNFDTTLYSTVPAAGSYWFHVSVQFGSDYSEAIQSFIATAVPTPTPTPTPGGGGGGGGGGGAPVSVTPTPITTAGACIGADFNHDGKVNSVDFSIMLAFWKAGAPFKNPCVDINGDRMVNSVDFSILLYQWGKQPAVITKP